MLPHKLKDSALSIVPTLGASSSVAARTGAMGALNSPSVPEDLLSSSEYYYLNSTASELGLGAQIHTFSL
jgi:hypothetical protein